MRFPSCPPLHAEVKLSPSPGLVQQIGVTVEDDEEFHRLDNGGMVLPFS